MTSEGLKHDSSGTFQQRAELDREEFLSRQASPKRGGIAETAAPGAHGDAIRAPASRGGCVGNEFVYFVATCQAQWPPPENCTLTAAPADVTDLVVKVTPAAESWKVWPTASDGSYAP